MPPGSHSRSSEVQDQAGLTNSAATQGLQPSQAELGVLGQEVQGGRLPMSLPTAPKHSPAACCGRTHPEQEVKAPEGFGLWHKRAAADGTQVRVLFRAELSFPPPCTTPACSRPLLAHSHPGRPQHAATFGAAGKGRLPVGSIPLTSAFLLLLPAGVLQQWESPPHAAASALGCWQHKCLLQVLMAAE